MSEFNKTNMTEPAEVPQDRIADNRDAASADVSRCVPPAVPVPAEPDHLIHRPGKKKHGRHSFSHILIRCLLGIVIVIFLFYLYLFITA